MSDRVFGEVVWIQPVGGGFGVLVVAYTHSIYRSLRVLSYKALGQGPLEKEFGTSPEVETAPSRWRATICYGPLSQARYLLGWTPRGRLAGRHIVSRVMHSS